MRDRAFRATTQLCHRQKLRPIWTAPACSDSPCRRRESPAPIAIEKQLPATRAQRVSAFRGRGPALSHAKGRETPTEILAPRILSLRPAHYSRCIGVSERALRASVTINRQTVFARHRSQPSAPSRHRRQQSILREAALPMPRVESWRLKIRAELPAVAGPWWKDMTVEKQGDSVHSS